MTMHGIQMAPPKVTVITSSNGGLSTDQIVSLALDKIMYVSDNAPPEIREQAIAFRSNMTNVLLEYVNLARREERATISAVLENNGHSDVAKMIRSI
jgi:hypothetical protein